LYVVMLSFAIADEKATGPFSEGRRESICFLEVTLIREPFLE
jgi:hypothetical protein